MDYKILNGTYKKVGDISISDKIFKAAVEEGYNKEDMKVIFERKEDRLVYTLEIKQ